jgi:hypothetical protein
MELKTALAPIVALLSVAFVASDASAYYASHLGRWLTRDPIGYDSGQKNLYEYVEGDPTNHTDPSGKAVYCSPEWIMDEAQKRKDITDNLGDGSSPHCWAVCMFGKCTGIGAPIGMIGADIGEMLAPSDDWLSDMMAHRRGFFCGLPTMLAVATTCDCCCGVPKEARRP